MVPGSHPSPWTRLYGIAVEARVEATAVAVIATGQGLLTLATPLAVQTLIGTVAFGVLLQPVVVLSALLFLALGFAAALQALQTLLAEQLSRRVFITTASRAAARLRSAREAPPPGADLRDLSTRFLDVALVEKTLLPLLLDGIAAALQITVGLLLLSVYHPVFLAAAVLLTATSWATVRLVAGSAATTAREESTAKYAVATALAGVAAGPSPDASLAEVDRAALEWLDARRRHFRRSFAQQLGFAVLGAIASTGMLLAGGALVIRSELSLGQLVAAEVVMALTVGSLAKIGSLLPKLYDLTSALSKLSMLLDLEAGPATTAPSADAGRPR